MEIKIRGVDDWLTDELDRIVKTEAYESRSQLIITILEKYVASRSSFLCEAIPEVTRELCKEAITEQRTDLDNCIRALTHCCKDISDTLDEFKSVLFPSESVQPPVQPLKKQD